jgi:hypothetical protein
VELVAPQQLSEEALELREAPGEGGKARNGAAVSSGPANRAFAARTLRSLNHSLVELSGIPMLERKSRVALVYLDGQRAAQVLHAQVLPDAL